MGTAIKSLWWILILDGHKLNSKCTELQRQSIIFPNIIHLSFFLYLRHKLDKLIITLRFKE